MKQLSHPVLVPSSQEFREFDSEDFWLPPGYHRNLPHWRLEGATYFVTMRQADSIPQAVLKQWQEAEAAWLWSNGIDPAWETLDYRRYLDAYAALPADLRQARHREKTRQLFTALDACHGSCILASPPNQTVVAGALHHFNGARLWVGDFVIMPNHVHVIAQPFPGVMLEEWLYSIKRFTATQLHQRGLHSDETGRAGHFWQKESFDRVIRNRAELERTRAYIANNPANLPAEKACVWRAEWLDAFAPSGSGHSGVAPLSKEE